MKKISQIIKKYKLEIFIIFTSFAFFSWLMFSSFSYENGYMQISTKSWSDFASHIPLIRSFSLGNNFPPQYPLFPGPAIKYHFLFYALVGLMEKIGFRLDIVINIFSALGLTLLVFMIYIFSKEIFKSRGVGILSIILFLFNSSLDFIRFFQKYPFSLNSFNDVIKNNSFVSFGPYDNSIISAFWNLNIYTNQRHLGLSYGLSLLLIYIILKTISKNETQKLSKYVICGVVLGLLFLLNIAVFLMTAVVILGFFVLFPKNRGKIFILLSLAFIIALPQYLYIESGESIFKLKLHAGYLINNLSIYSFVNYWWQNLGINIILIPIAFFISSKRSKKIFLSFFSLFIIGNIIQFSPEIAANHKFFNFFVIVASMYSSYLLITLFKKNLSFKAIAFFLLLLLILSGVINFFPLFNDTKIYLADYPKNKDMLWIMNNTPKNSNFLNTNYLYDNASLAGRKIFLGWPYFAWSQGYDTTLRDDLRLQLLKTNDKKYFCDNISRYNINYVELNLYSEDALINIDFFKKNFKNVYDNPKSNYQIYSLIKCY